MGRLSQYDPELAKEICEQVSQGKAVKSVLDSKDHYPHFVTWCRWVDNNEDLRNLYYASLKDKASAKEGKYDQYITDLESGKLDPHAAKVLLDATRWQMATLNAKIYGAKNVALDGEELSGITINIHKKEGE